MVHEILTNDKESRAGRASVVNVGIVFVGTRRVVKASNAARDYLSPVSLGISIPNVLISRRVIGISRVSPGRDAKP